MDFDKMSKSSVFDQSQNNQKARFYKNPMNIPNQYNNNTNKNLVVITGDNLYYHNNGGMGANIMGQQQYQHQSQYGLPNKHNGNNCANNFNGYQRQRFTPYYNKRTYANAVMPPNAQQRFYNNFFNQQQSSQSMSINGSMIDSIASFDDNNNQFELTEGSPLNSTSMVSNLNGSQTMINGTSGSSLDSNENCVTLQISNLDTTIDERALKQYLINKLKPITSVISIYFEAVSVAKVKLPSANHAKQVIAFLHRKKIGHKRITVSYTRESSSMEPSTLRCQVAGLLKDIPNYKLSMFKFRELFQSRFKTSISVIDLYDMKDICTIIENENEEKFIVLRTELIDSIENSDLMECLQHSVPYCTVHFVKTHRGWAEQEIDPLPTVLMTIAQVRNMIYTLLRSHQGDIPIASIIYCIQAELQLQLERNDNGVHFEHLISCISGVQIASNKFGIKILSWNKGEGSPKEPIVEEMTPTRYTKYSNIPESFSQVSREIVELIKLSPKSTLKFSRFIPAYHNHFGKQCRVADYGYTKLIDLFEALTSVVQVMGEGENRQITLTHKVQLRRFTSDLLRVLRSQSTKSIMLSQLPMIFEQVHNRKFDITDYGVCDIKDILDGLVNSNVIVINSMPHMMDMMISIPKRKQSPLEIEKTGIFAGEVIELFKHASQFTIPFEKFACSYHYHFGYQCRLCDYGFLKLADLMEAITGIVEMEFANDEDRKISLSPKAAQRVFSDQLKLLIEGFSGAPDTLTNLHEVLVFHKKTYGYQIAPQALGFSDMLSCIKSLPYIEMTTSNGFLYIKCLHDDQAFRQKCYAACRLLMEADQEILALNEFIQLFAEKFNTVLNEQSIETMKHAIEIQSINDMKYVTITKMMRLLIHIIGLIENRGSMKLQDIRSAMNLTINSCFAFGYPNLMSLIQAFPDIFVPVGAKQLNYRSEIKLNNQCLLTKDDFMSYINSSLNANKLNSASAIATEYNASVDSAVGSANNSMFANSFSTPKVKIEKTSPQSNQSYLSSSSNAIDPLENNIHPAFNSSLAQLNSNDIFEIENYQMALHSTKIEYNEDADQSSSINFEFLSNSMPFIKDDAKENLLQMSLNESACAVNGKEFMPLQRSFDGKDQLNMRKRFMNMSYDPPKPDTPPSSSSAGMSFWFDPIWNGEMNTPTQKTLNVRLPELKIFNDTPKLDTPTVMTALARKHKFSFDLKRTV